MRIFRNLRANWALSAAVVIGISAGAGLALAQAESVPASTEEGDAESAEPEVVPHADDDTHKVPAAQGRSKLPETGGIVDPLSVDPLRAASDEESAIRNAKSRRASEKLELDDSEQTQAAKRDDSDMSALNSFAKDWPARPRLAVAEMSAKYGAPTELTTESAIWRDAGSFKRIKVSKTEWIHDFPKPHFDFVEHTVLYPIPVDRIDDIAAFDSSVHVLRTAGELSARCDLEAHNIAALNLARDIADGRKNSAQARQAMVSAVREGMLGKDPLLARKLQFEPKGSGAEFVDKVTMSGASMRLASLESPQSKSGKASRGKNVEAKVSGDAEALALLLALNENEIHAAKIAIAREPEAAVLDYAERMHREHGQNAIDTMNLAKKLQITPVETQAVEELQLKGVNALIPLASLNGNAFSGAYVDAMVQDHSDALELIDEELLKLASKSEIKKHLEATRKHVADHLESAIELQSTSRPRS